MQLLCHERCVLIQPGVDDCIQENFNLLVRVCL